MKNQNFLITCLQLWESEIGTTIKNMALELSHQNKVLYVNTPIDHSTWLKRRSLPKSDLRMDVINKKRPPLRQINENLWVLDFPFMIYSINKIPFPFLFDFFNKINNRKIAKYIQKQTKALNFDHYINFIDNDIYRSLYLKELLSPRLSIYYRRDYVIGQAYWKKHGSRLEPEIVAKSDLAMANSTLFCEEISRYNPEVFLLETGVNLELYDAAKEYTIPGDIAHISRPIAGYVGSIDSTRLDEDLMYRMAQERPNDSFVFIGPEDEFFKKSRLHQMKNVFFTGSRKLEELPVYIAAFDICLNPQKINEITLGNYPLKIDEYLALGKPVVATTTHIMNEVFREQVHLAEGVEDNLKAIDQAIEESGDENLKAQRIQFAKTHSWAARIEQMYKIINDFEKKQSK
ncbi:MAG: glycosyltransferase [Bacteroidales bacterium]|nr:glycosyltransferase [Bacteroidales bacterium]